MEISNTAYETFVIRILREAADTARGVVKREPLIDSEAMLSICAKLEAEAAMREVRLSGRQPS